MTDVRLYVGVAGDTPALAGGPLREPETLRLGALRVNVDAAAAVLTAANSGATLHYFRYADATLKPLPAAPPPLRLARGDAYIAVAGGPALDSLRIARFLHLRDYFNAQRLAEVLLAHLAEAGEAEGVGVLVVEAR
ncbi:MAG: hypothetical protein IT317_18605 [Anaerolineales bacterium]|nr:hypothetical protein [Anaerolineales bacterium]